MFTRMLIVLYILVFLLLVSSCSDTAVVSSGPSGVSNSAPNVNSAATPVSDLISTETVSDSCIKNDGWLLPPSKKETSPERSDPNIIMMRTKKGSEVEVIQITYSFGYANAWTYAQDLRCKAGDPDYLNGKFATPWYTELSLNGKVFAYSIFAKEVWEKSPSNSDAGEERFMYDIRDDDGDGIFETLAHGSKMMVPNWVLK